MKLSLCLIKYHTTKTYVGVEVHNFFASSLNEGEWSASCPSRLTPGKLSLVHSRCAGLAPKPDWTLWLVEKSLSPANGVTPTVHPVAFLYTDGATAASKL
jgi:hypothetical protein